jgi:ribosomal protein S19
MSRSLWKGIFLNNKILRYKNNTFNNKNFIKTHSRSSAIPEFLQESNVVIGIYTGKKYKSFKIPSRKYLGYKLGEFAFTRQHNKPKKAKKKTKGK